MNDAEFANALQEAMDNLDVVRVAVGAVHDPETSEAFRELTNFLQDLSERDEPDEPTVAFAILQLASSLGDVGPALKEVATNLDHTSQLGDISNALDDLAQTVAKGFNEGRV